MNHCRFKSFTSMSEVCKFVEEYALAKEQIITIFAEVLGIQREYTVVYWDWEMEN